ncbi:MAG: PASTA domain-containing protein [Leptospirales bacterium]
MSNESSPKPAKQTSWLRSITRVAFFYFIGFTLFFVVGFAIVSLRVSSGEKVRVPDITGKLYLEEHNSLHDSGFKVEIAKRNLVEYPYGYILSQSEPPGRLLKSGAKLILVVNYSKNIIAVPELIGLRIDLAEEMLNNIPIGDKTYKLVQGSVTEIPSDRPEGEVLSQYPEAGVTVFPEYPVSLLVSAGKKGPRKLSALEGMQIEQLKNMAYRLKVPLHIVKEDTNDFAQDGVVANIDFGKNGNTLLAKKLEGAEWTATVYKFKNNWPENYPNRYFWLSVRDDVVANKLVTIAEKIVSTDGETSYKNFAYMYLSSDVPMFLRQKKTLVFWEGYHEARTKPSVALSEEDSDQPVFAEEVKKEIPKEIEPIFEKRIQSVRI